MSYDEYLDLTLLHRQINIIAFESLFLFFPFSLYLSLSLPCVFSLSVHLPDKVIDAIRRRNAVFDSERPLLYPIPTWRMNSRIAILPATSTRWKILLRLSVRAKSLVSVSHMHKLFGALLCREISCITRYRTRVDKSNITLLVIKKKVPISHYTRATRRIKLVKLHFLLPRERLSNLIEKLFQVNSRQITEL